MAVSIKNSTEISKMRRAGQVVADVLEAMAAAIEPNVETRWLDEIAVRELAKHKAASSFKGYHGYPASVCVSINDEVVHGIPGSRQVKEGDLVSLDFGAVVEGFHGDGAITIIVGSGSLQARRLVDTTLEALNAGITAALPGNYLGDISSAIQLYAESRGFGVVREYTGHGIGRAMHEEPLVPNFGRIGEGIKLKAGMTFALEPMLTTGDWHTRVGTDHWVVYTADGSLAAHFEHTIAITESEAEVLTLPSRGKLLS
jgi:methionyl aminopeptidase